MACYVNNHPLVQDALSTLRRTTTTTEQFRKATKRISHLLIAEATRNIRINPIKVETSLGIADGFTIASDVVFVPILRAGLGMLEVALELIPAARVGYIGLERDETTAAASTYYSKLPNDLTSSQVFVLDPMLATSGSAVSATDILRKVGATDCHLICIIAAKDGIRTFEKCHPNVPVHTSAVDPTLNEQQYIVPGLGDFGDKLYGTS
jgi:uracil phosphoribosyltransferase|tara:strand:- start:108 stop:731 length:624 start_codon:yes stop_codon:yes gene_type:complete